ncbi:MAG TPA: zf-HC2 domain-containing protein [Longimicrobiaceae bacterium]|nr:zf-HC2 domain-containing protein [Longimicrobiaceae bacterium]
MTYDEWTDRLSEYLDDELAPGERDALDEHLRECDGCRTVLEELRQVTLRAASLRDSFPEKGLWPEIARRIGHPEVELSAPVIDLAAQRKARLQRTLRWTAAAAAVLVLGIGIGRTTRPDPQRMGPVAATPPAASATSPYQVAAMQHLVRSQALLTTFRDQAAGGGAGRQSVSAWADDLLVNTRLLLDSPAADDPRLRPLLQDLELVLVQIAQLPPRGSASSASEADLAAEAIDQSGVLNRMRTVVRPGAVPTMIQGES